MRRYVFTIAAGLLIAAAALYLVARSHEREKEDYILSRVELLSARIDATRQNLFRVSGYVFSKDIAVPQITSLMADASRGNSAVQDAARKKLRGLLSATYETLLEFGFRQLHFQLPDNTSFLRMHSPEKYGDDLSGVRLTVETANSRRVPVAAFEEGRIYNGYRFVYPLFHNDLHCGSAEVSFSMASYISMLEELDPSDYYFVVRKEVVESTVFEDEKSGYAESALSPLFMYDREVMPSSNHDDLFQENSDKLESILGADEDAGFVAEKDGKEKLVMAHQIRNLNGVPVACLVSVSEDPMIRRIDANFQLVMAVIALGSILLTSTVIMIVHEQCKLKRQSATDPLTGLWNRMAISGAIRHEQARAKRYGTPFSILMLDLDHFKKINDRFGHGEGDAVLRNLAAAMLKNMRKVDHIARWGGEEFVIVLPGTTLEAAEKAVEKLRGAIEKAELSQKAKVTTSIGVACYAPTEAEEIDPLIARADAALYQAKARGRNQVAVQPSAC